VNKKSKGFIELSIIILLVLVIVGGLLYFSWQKGMIKTRTNPEVPSTPSIIDNENTASSIILDGHLNLLKKGK